jgi:hypothetical protein
VKRNPKDYPSKLFDVMGPLLEHGDWVELTVIDATHTDHQIAYLHLNSNKPRQFLSTFPKSGIYGLQHGHFVDKRAKRIPWATKRIRRWGQNNSNNNNNNNNHFTKHNHQQQPQLKMIMILNVIKC